MYVKNKFPRTSDAKIKEGVFVGPQIRELIQDGKIWRPAKWNGKSSMGIIKKMSLLIFWEIIR